MIKHVSSHSSDILKEALYRIWCGVSRLSDSGVNRLGDTSAFVNPSGQLLLTRRGKTRMDGVGIVFEFCTAPFYATTLHYQWEKLAWSNLEVGHF